MSLFVMSDLHLSTALETNKSMEVFGRRWTGYTEKIEKNWRAIVDDDDTVIVPGDVSWASSVEEAISDFEFIDSLPGNKILMKGNHDFWWSTLTKLNDFVTSRGFSTVSFLHNNAYIVEDKIICGTRGWFPDENNANIPREADYEKLVARETSRFKLSCEEGLKLSADKGREILAFFHFPLYWSSCEIRPLVDALHEYNVHRCYFGHIHGKYNVPGREMFEDIEFNFISADFLDFVPKIISLD